MLRAGTSKPRLARRRLHESRVLCRVAQHLANRVDGGIQFVAGDNERSVRGTSGVDPESPLPCDAVSANPLGSPFDWRSFTALDELFYQIKGDFFRGNKGALRGH